MIGQCIFVYKSLISLILSCQCGCQIQHHHHYLGLCLNHQYSDFLRYLVLQPEYLIVWEAECNCIFIHHVSCYVCCPAIVNATCCCNILYKSRFASWNELCAFLMMSNMVVKGYTLIHLTVCFTIHLLTWAGTFVENNPHEFC